MTNIHRVCSKSEDETRTLAAQMAGDILPVTVIALFGDLGTGKTIFSKGFASGLGVEDHVGSPTFKLISEYSGRGINLYHVDCYRMRGSDDFLNIGGEFFLHPTDGITLIEWANIIQDLLPDDTITIQFERVPKKPTERIISFNGWNR